MSGVPGKAISLFLIRNNKLDLTRLSLNIKFRYTIGTNYLLCFLIILIINSFERDGPQSGNKTLHNE